MNRQLGRRLQIATVCIDQEMRNKLHSVAELGLHFDLTAEIGQYPTDAQSRLLKIETNGIPDAVLLDIDKDRAAALTCASNLSKAYGDEIAIIAISSSPNPDAIIATMRNGCCEYLLRPFDATRLLETFQQLQKKKSVDHAPAGGQVVVLAGVKGGCGVTTLSTHLATYLARENRLRVLLIDLHPDLGNVGTLLGFGNQGYSFYDVVANLYRLDSELVNGLILRHESGAHVLVSRLREEAPSGNLMEDSQDTLALLRTMYDVILLDTPPGLSFLNLVTIEKPDVVSLVLTPEVAAIRNLVCCIDHLNKLDCPRSNIEVVVNRYSRRGTLTDEQIATAARLPITHRIPNKYSAVNEANNLGRPLSATNKSDFVGALVEWSDNIAKRVMKTPTTARDPRQGKSAIASILGL